LLLMIWLPVSGILSIISLLSYIFTIFVESVRIKDNSTSFGYIYLAFLTLHFSYGIGSLSGLFRVDYLFNSN
jgi:hypothetical protein